MPSRAPLRGSTIYRVDRPSAALTWTATRSPAGLTETTWAPEGSAVLALARAHDGRGVQYTLAYELDVIESAGRWEVSAIQMDPTT